MPSVYVIPNTEPDRYRLMVTFSLFLISRSSDQAQELAIPALPVEEAHIDPPICPLIRQRRRIRERDVDYNAGPDKRMP
jgi:hypothetical protein